MRRRRLGMITPSSNSILEPVTSAMLANVAGITAHFARFRVTEIALDAAALNQFDASAMLPAADLLADTKVDAIAWNGTSASWLGASRDRSLCAREGSCPLELEASLFGAVLFVSVLTGAWTELSAPRFARLLRDSRRPRRVRVASLASSGALPQPDADASPRCI
jgi:hypothetical protein